MTASASSARESSSSSASLLTRAALSAVSAISSSMDWANRASQSCTEVSSSATAKPNCADCRTLGTHGLARLAGAGGIEPPNGGIKIRCLTAWLRPNGPVGWLATQVAANARWPRRSIGPMALVQPGFAKATPGTARLCQPLRGARPDFATHHAGRSRADAGRGPFI